MEMQFTTINQHLHLHDQADHWIHFQSSVPDNSKPLTKAAFLGNNYNSFLKMIPAIKRLNLSSDHVLIKQKIEGLAYTALFSC